MAMAAGLCQLGVRPDAAGSVMATELAAAYTEMPRQLGHLNDQTKKPRCRVSPCLQGTLRSRALVVSD